MQPIQIKIFIFFLIFYLLIFQSGHAQYLLSGKILEKGNQDPIPFAMVYLSNTSIGTVSAEDGSFELSFGKGRYDLIINKLGYQKAIFQFNTDSLTNEMLTFLVEAQDVELTPLEVEDVRDKNWYENLKIFKLFFLGNSTNARRATIENERTLILDDISNPGLLLARSNEPLSITNFILGYDLLYTLVSFEYDPEHQQLVYGGYPLFIPQEPKNKTRANRIERNRRNSYQGSLLHFLRSLYSGNLGEDGFQIFRLQKIPYHERPSDEELSLMLDSLMNFGTEQEKRELYYELKSNPNIIEIKDRRPLDVSNYLTKKENGDLEIAFDDYWVVRNTRFRTDRNFYIEYDIKEQESIFHLTNGKISIQENGSYFPVYDLYVEGYMAWQKIADLLPFDYWPEEDD